MSDLEMSFQGEIFRAVDSVGEVIDQPKAQFTMQTVGSGHTRMIVIGVDGVGQIIMSMSDLAAVLRSFGHT
jgi:hypothetical protein